jgi:hypothetical protein
MLHCIANSSLLILTVASVSMRCRNEMQFKFRRAWTLMFYFRISDPHNANGHCAGEIIVVPALQTENDSETHERLVQAMWSWKL